MFTNISGIDLSQRVCMSASLGMGNTQLKIDLDHEEGKGGRLNNAVQRSRSVAVRQTEGCSTNVELEHAHTTSVCSREGEIDGSFTRNQHT